MSDLEQLEQEMITLQAQNQWLTNVNSKMLVMLKNAADVFDEYVRQLDTLKNALTETQTIYSRLHINVQEALNERNGTGFRLPETTAE